MDKLKQVSSNIVKVAVLLVGAVAFGGVAFAGNSPEGCSVGSYDDCMQNVGVNASVHPTFGTGGGDAEGESWGITRSEPDGGARGGYVATRTSNKGTAFQAGTVGNPASRTERDLADSRAQAAADAHDAEGNGHP